MNAGPEGNGGASPQPVKAALMLRFARQVKAGDFGGVQATAGLLAAGASETPKLDRISAAAIFEPLPPIHYLVQALDICPGAPTLFAGFGFSGKTVAAQALALAVATGGHVWGRFAARQGRVLHIDYEQGRRTTLGRYQRLARAELLSPTDLADRLEVVCMPRMCLDALGAEDLLTREAENLDLMIIDSLRASAPNADENNSEVRNVLDLLTRVSERTGCVVLVLHHARKPQQNARGGARMAIRGSGAIYDACSSVLVLESERPGLAIVTHEKARDSGVPTAPFELHVADVESHGNPRDGLRVDAVPCAGQRGTAPADKQGAMRAKVLAAIASNPGTSLKGLREHVRANNDAVGVALRSLISEGTVRKELTARGANAFFTGGAGP